VWEGEDLNIGLSTGISFSDRGRGSPESLLAEADRAMYQAKRDGPGEILTAGEGSAASRRRRFRRGAERHLN
jgi:GGDEF domain-containing protein